MPGRRKRPIKGRIRPSSSPQSHKHSSTFFASNDSSASLSNVYKNRKHVYALLDTGAVKSVIGLRMARKIARLTGERLQLTPSSRRFKFGVDLHDSCGAMHIVIPTPSGTIRIQADVVKADVPFLFGLDAMDSCRVQVLSVQNALEHIPAGNSIGWRVPLVRKDGHILLSFLPVSVTHAVHYSRTQLHRLHRSLYHPSAAKLYELLRRADPSKLDADSRDILEDISRSCHACQTYSRAQLSFSVTMPGEVKFNRSLRLDICYISDNGKSKPVLHVVDAATHFQAAAWLEKQDVTHVWNAFLICWARVFVGNPEEVLTDQGSVFISEGFRELCSKSDIRLKHVPVESHNSLSVGEGYHNALKRTFGKLRVCHPKADAKLLLQLSVFAINTTANPRGLVPTLLVFGILPKLRDVPGTGGKLTQKERLSIMKMATEEYSRWVAQERVRLGLTKRLSRTVDDCLEPGDAVYVWREKPSLWLGPYRVSQSDGKTVFVSINQKEVPFSITAVKRCLGDSINIHWTEIIHPGDPRSNSPEMLEAIRKEMQGLVQKGTFRLTILPEQERFNVVPSKFVLCLKHEDGKTRHKARFVMGGHKDVEKKLQVHTAYTLSQTSLRVLLALASIMGFDVWTSDVQQAYLQSAVEMQRDIFTKPDCLELGPNEFLRLMLPLYGIAESGDYWGSTLTAHCLREAKFKQSPADLSLFYRRLGTELTALSGNYIDDLLQAAPPDVRDEIQSKLTGTFEVGKTKDVNEGSPVTFLGIEISRRAKALHASMQSFIHRLTPLQDDAGYSEFASLRASLQWLAHARPDLAAYCSITASITSREYARMSREAIDDINSRVRNLKGTASLSLTFPELDADSLKLVCYSDASFGSRYDGSSQLGYLICLADTTGRASILSYKSSKIQRVCRSAMAAETLAFSASFDAAYVLKKQLAAMLGREIPLVMAVDSHSFFDVITSNSYPREGRLALDLSAARQSYRAGEIEMMMHVLGKHMPADDLTKLVGNGELTRLLKIGRLDHPVFEYIDRFLPTTETGTNEDSRTRPVQMGGML